MASPELPTNAVVYAPSADSTGATDRAAIQTALNNDDPVYLQPEATYYLDQPVTIPSGGRIRCVGPGRAIIVAGSGWTPSAAAVEDVAVCFFAAVTGVPSTATTTLTAQAYGDQESVGATASIAASSWILIASPKNAPLSCTFSNGSATVTCTDHSFRPGQPVILATGGSLPTNFSPGVRYYVRSSVLGATFELAATYNGTPIVAGSAGSGSHTANDERHQELAQVLSVSGGGPFTLTIDRRLNQDHAAGSRVYVLSSPTRNVALSGLSIRATSTNHAIGLLVSGVDKLELDLEAAGFTRHAIEVRDGSDQVLIRELRWLGGGNSILGCYSSHRVMVASGGCDGNGVRYHSQGVARGLFKFRHLCNGPRIEQFAFRRGCTAVQLWGARNPYVGSISIDDMDFTRRAATDPELLAVSGVAMGATAIELSAVASGNGAEKVQGGHFGSVFATACRVPDSDGRQFVFLAVNTSELHIGSLTVENTGQWSGIAPYAIGAMCLFDVEGITIDGYVCKGVDRPLTLYGAFNRGHISELAWDPRDALSDGSIGLVLGMDTVDDSAGGAQIQFSIGKYTMVGPPTTFISFGHANRAPSALALSRLRIVELSIINLQRSWGNLLFGWAASGGVDFNVGESCEIRQPLAATFMNGSPNVGVVGHGWPVGMPVYFDTSGSLPTNFAIGNRYFVVSVVDANTVTLAASLGGGAISAGSTGSGTHEIASELITVVTPTSSEPLGTGVMCFANSADQGQENPAGYHLVAFGGHLQTARLTDSHVGLPGDRVEVVASQRTLDVNNAASTVYGVVISPKVAAVTGRATILSR